MAKKGPIIFRVMPSSWHPYLELTRIQKPAGLMGFYFPYFIGLFFAARIQTPRPSNTKILSAAAFLLVDGVLCRSGGCAWNDIVDQDLDRQVARYKGRPMARGAISTTNASIFTVAILVARLGLLSCMPQQCIFHGLLSTFMALIYPFMKRVCHYPQLVLGTAVGWCVFIAYSTLGVDLNGPKQCPLVMLAASQMLWNVTYDIVYAFQDLKDDIKAGVKSMAVRFQQQPKVILSPLSICMVLSCFVGGVLADFGLLYFGGAMSAAMGLVAMLIRLDVKDPSSCRWFFTTGQWVVSGCLLMGVVGEFAVGGRFVALA